MMKKYEMQKMNCSKNTVGVGLGKLSLMHGVKSIKTFDDLSREWRDNWLAPRDIGQATKLRYTDILQRLILPQLGALRLKNLGPAEIDALMNSMAAAGYAGRTIRNTYSVVGSVIKYGYRKGILKENVCSRCEPLPVGAGRRKLQCFTAAQAKIFLKALEACDLKYRCLFTLALYGGFRRGELCGLCLEDIDFDGHQIYVRHSLCAVGNELVLKGPKSKSGERTVCLPEICFELLKGLLGMVDAQAAGITDMTEINANPDLSSAECAAAGMPDAAEICGNPVTHNDGYTAAAGMADAAETCMPDIQKQGCRKVSAGKSGVRAATENIHETTFGMMAACCRQKADFPNYVFRQKNQCSPLSPQQATNEFRKILKSHNAACRPEDALPMIRLHDLRHTSASLLLSAHTDIETVSHRLGHSRTSMTLDFYCHAMPSGDHAAAGTLSAMLQ